MSALDHAAEWGHEELLVHHDRDSGLRCVIAIHDTTLGTAAGGTRMRTYPSLDEAATDALRLARAMTYKSAMAEMPFGGGKAVILGDPARDKTRALLAAYARVIDSMGGRFNTGCDMGMDERDMAVLSRMTRHVQHAPAGQRLDTADLAALGVFESIRAAASVLGRGMDGLRVAVQGLGNVGFQLARRLSAAGARLVVADVDVSRAERAAAELRAERVDPAVVYDVEADVFSPNAAGGVLNRDTIPRLRCGAVVGGANEQLADPAQRMVGHILDLDLDLQQARLEDAIHLLEALLARGVDLVEQSAGDDADVIGDLRRARLGVGQRGDQRGLDLLERARGHVAPEVLDHARARIGPAGQARGDHDGSSH